MPLYVAQWLAGCVSDPVGVPAGGSLVRVDDSVYGVNAWDGTLVRTRLIGSDSVDTEWTVGKEPTRIAIVGDELWISLRGERAVAVWSTGPEPREEARFVVGAEPYGLVASPDGSTVYLALSQQDEVVEIDAATRAVSRRFPVHDDPRWLVITPEGRAVFVGYAVGSVVTRVDLATGDTSDHHPPVTTSQRDGHRPMTPRTTGDPVITPSGDALLVPMLYADNLSAGEQPRVSDGVIEAPPIPYYTSSGGMTVQAPIGRLNPAVVVFPLEPEQVGPSYAIAVAGLDRGGVARGALSSLVVAPDGDAVWAVSEAADAATLVSLSPAKGQGDEPGMGELEHGGNALPGARGFVERPAALVRTGSFPGGLVFDEDGQPWVQAKGDRTVQRLDAEQALEMLDRAHRGVKDAFPGPVVGTVETRPAGAAGTDPEVEAGRRLFLSAVDGRVTTRGSGAACGTCHLDGRTDGLTWAFDGEPRQTPALFGALETAPVTWTGGVADLETEAAITSVGRMGGVGLSDLELGQLAAYVGSLRVADLPERGVVTRQVERGEELFYSEEVGCSGCHSGPLFTDNATYPMFGIAANTPPLVGVSATAPYLHDGREPTLRSLLERLRDSEMGSTATLSDEDLDALDAYLRTL